MSNKRNGRNHGMKSASEPINAWRLVILAKPKQVTPKYQEPPYVFDSGVRPEALKGELKIRDEYMSLPKIRHMYENKRTFANNPNTLKNFGENMDKHIAKAWNSIYNEYNKARRAQTLKELERKKLLREQKYWKARSKSKSGKKGKGKDDDGGSFGSHDREKQFLEWALIKALPRREFKPEPINRGPRGDLEALQPRIDSMSVPQNPTKKYVSLPPPKHLVKEAALNYVPNEGILKLCILPPRLAKKESVIVSGAVKRGALLYKATERDVQLATPRAIAMSLEPDLKENPFKVSPAALKYKATPRIIEMAKPREIKW